MTFVGSVWKVTFWGILSVYGGVNDSGCELAVAVHYIVATVAVQPSCSVGLRPLLNPGRDGVGRVHQVEPLPTAAWRNHQLPSAPLFG